ncbi:MAG: carbohydrate porin [Candidatus Korobacteraceae bacterium]
MLSKRPVARRRKAGKKILAAVICGRLWLVLVLWIAAAMMAPSAHGQDSGSGASESTEQPEADETVQSIFPHFKEGRFWISGQANFIFQANPPFYAKYSGAHSFQPYYDKATSRVLTLYTGFEVTKSIETLLDIEEAGGAGLSQAFGLAGFTNLDVVRNPQLSKAPYLARLIYHQVIGLSHEKIENVRSPLSTFSELPARRLEFRLGKFSLADFFDLNSVGSDSHLQFMNWTIDQNGGYDYAADTRGYTWGAILEYQSPKWGMRFGEALLPTVANGETLVWNLRRANAENVEFELHRGVLRKQDGMIRLLSYVNNANMGIYQVAIDQYLEGKVPTPEITNHPLQVTTKYGFGINFEQALSRNITIFGRFGWNNGKTESWVYTECDQTVSAGAGFAGRMWKRKYDRAGIAFASNGISKEHAQYLAYGGLGFLLGDGGMTYGRENILESYYTAHTWRGIYLGPDLQYIVNPGYNQVRGPVTVASLRLHVEF